MNILHTETLKNWGGQQNKVLKEMIAIKELGHTPFLLCNPQADISKKAKEHGIKVYEFPMHKKNFHKTVPYLLDLIKEQDIDVIFTHGSTDSWIGAVAGKLSSKKPMLIRERHNLFPIKGFLSRLQYRYIFDKVAVLSEAIKEYMLSFGVKEEKIFLLPDAVNVKKYENSETNFRKETFIPEDAIVLGAFTSLYREKGVYDVFEVAKKLLKKYENLYIVFGGNYKSNIKEEIDTFFEQNRYDKSRIIWTGFREDGANIMKSFDIFLFPSHSEGLGTVLIEAFACKLPCVVYDIRPMNDLVKNDRSGLCVSFLDTKALAKECEKLILDKSLRKKMGKVSFEKVLKDFDETNLKENMKKLLEA